MDPLACIAAIIAALVFLVQDNARGVSSMSLGLFFLTVALIFQFTHPVHALWHFN